MNLDQLAEEAVRELREAGRSARFTSTAPGSRRSRRSPHGRSAWVYVAAGFATAALIGLATSVLMSRGEPGPPPTTALPASDRWGIAAIDLPDEVEEIAAVFDAMPLEVGGHERLGEPDGEHVVEYGAGSAEGSSLGVQSSEHRIGEDGSPLSIPAALIRMASAPELEIAAGVLDGDAVWLHGSTLTEDGTEWFLFWGEADGEYLFGFNAWSLDDLDDLVAAFVATLDRADIVGAAATGPQTFEPEVTTLPENPIPAPRGQADPATITGEKTWAHEGWVIETAGMDGGDVSLEGEWVFPLLIASYPLDPAITEALASGASEASALRDFAEGFGEELAADRANDSESPASIEPFSESAELVVDGRPAVRVLAGTRIDGEVRDALLHAFVMDGRRLVMVFIEQEFLDVDAELLIEFAPVLDRYLESMRFDG